MTRLRRILELLVLLFGLGTAAGANAYTVLVLGDSLSAGYGIAPGKGWVDLLARRLAARPSRWTVVNASISGDTTSGGLARLDAAIDAHRPDVVVIELGGNDALRGQPIGIVRENLARIIERCQATRARVVLLGMRIPPNYGPVYTQAFEAMYQALGERDGVALVAFFLEGVALDPDLMQPDGIHPTEQAQPLLLEAVWPVLEPQLAAVERDG